MAVVEVKHEDIYERCIIYQREIRKMCHYLL